VLVLNNGLLANRVHCFEHSGMIVLRLAGAAAALSVYSLQLKAESKSPSGSRTHY
jgi:hypothetical protein